MEFTSLLTTLEQNVYTITLNRPDSYNACNEALTLELQDALRFATDSEDVRCVVLTGAGRAFCSGQDLKDAPSGGGKRSLADSLQRRYNPIIQLMSSMPKPIIAGINGVAAVAGLSLALAADLRIMSRKAKLVEAFIGIALIPDSGATYYYPRLLGYPKAFEFATMNSPIEADEALRLGLVSSIVEHDAFPTAVSKLAKAYASGPTKAFGFVKHLLRKGETLSLEEMLTLEVDFQQQAGESSDYQEGVQAFIEKRAPNFTGK